MFKFRILLLISFFSPIFSMEQQNFFEHPSTQEWFLFVPDHLRSTALTWEQHGEKIVLITTCLKQIDVTRYVNEWRSRDCRN